MLANSFKFKPAPATQTLWHFSLLRFLVSVFYRVHGRWSVLLFSLGKLVNGYIRHCGGLCLSASSSNQLKVHTQTLWHFSILRFLVSFFYTRGTPRVQFANIRKVVLCQDLPHSLRLCVDPCMARYAQSLNSSLHA